MSRLDRLEQHFDAAETRLVREFKGGRGLVRPAVAGAGVGEGPGARGADEVAELRAQVEALSKQLVSLQEQVQGRGGSAVASPTLANGGTRVGDMTPAPLGREKAGGSTPRTALVGSHKTVA